MNNNQLHVIFGAGPVGKATARELVKLGQPVRMVSRGGQASDLPAEVEVAAGDAYSAATVTKLTKGAAAVYQCAQPEYHQWVEKFPPLQAAILEGTAANGAKLIVVENLYMYGDTNSKPMTEDLPNNPNTRKGKVRAAMSEALLAAHRAGKVRVAIGRASDFIGPEYSVGGNLVMYPALAGNTANALGSLDMPHSFTYIPDFGKALAILGTRDEALGQIWHIPSPAPLTQRELMTMIFKETGHNPKVRAGGRFMMSLIGMFNAGSREMVEMMYEFEKPFILDSRKFERTFGMQATPIQQAIRETVAWFRAHPKEQATTTKPTVQAAQS